MAAPRDIFSNKFYGSVTESGANTLTFGEIQTNVDVFSKQAWVINRLEWYIPSATLGLLVGAGDRLSLAFTSSNKMSALGLDDPGVIDLLDREIAWVGTPASAFYDDQPIIRDFGDLPGGGVIVTPRPLYVALKGTSLASAGTVSVRGYFTRMELKADEYLELIDFYRIVS